MNTTSNELRFRLAKQRVVRIKCFYGNLMAYCLVIPALGYVNYHTSDFPWVLFPMAGWGFGLLLRGLDAFGRNPFLGRNWEARKIRELMSKDSY